jgi:hypothetical protein
MAWRKSAGVLILCLAVFMLAVPAHAQTVTATLEGRTTDSTGGSLAKVNVTAANTATGFTRSTQSSDTGEYTLPALPVGEYSVTAQLTGFQKAVKTVTLQVGQLATLDFVLVLGQVEQKVTVQAEAEVQEPTRTQVSTVITANQIENLPVNGRQFIDFALLSPAVQIGDTTSGSTDVIVEPVTKLSFAGQNIHFNFIAVDGADNISTASGIQRGTPSQEAVREFRVINTDYSTEFGRATGGIVNIITKSGTNDLHGTLYEYFRNNALDAKSILQAPGLNILRQNQFGASIGGPIARDKTFVFANYEGQRRGESPFYNSVVLKRIGDINAAKVKLGLPPEPAGLKVLRTNNTDNGFLRFDHSFSDREFMFLRYFINDGRLTNQSPLNDGFDLPSAFKDNFYRDQSLVGSVTSTFTPTLINEVRGQYARRSFDFPTDTTQPHLEVFDTFTGGVNRGNPDFYRETRFELVDNVTWNHNKHTVSFGGNYNFVRTTESFPLFFPFEADFGSLDAFLGAGAFAATGPAPGAILFERFNASTTPAPFTEPTINPSIYQGKRIPTNIRNQAEGTLDHTYNGLFIQDKWRATSRLTLNGGFRWEFETWPAEALNNRYNNFDPRVGLAYNVGTSRNVVVRAGFGLFHGIIPAPLLACQKPSCGGFQGPFPGRTNEDALNATTGLFAFASGPGITSAALKSLLAGNYPDSTPAGFCPGGFLSGCGFFGASTIVRFAKNHQNPYGIQASLSVEFEPLPDTSLSITALHVRGVHLGSFFNINQPAPQGFVQAHTSGGGFGCKKVYFANAGSLLPGVPCATYPPPTTPLFPGTAGAGKFFPYALYFEADSRWNSVFDGLLINLNKRLSHQFSYGISYTFSKTLDDGPNPSFVLIPQDSRNIHAERALSSDDVRNRFVGNATLASPTTWNLLLRDLRFSTIVTLQSPQHFTKFAGFDANGDVFGNNDRVGLEPRNTFKGDTLKTVDIRLARTFPVREKMSLEAMFEAFNLLNSVNVRFFNTVYGAADFCPVAGPNVCGPGPFFKEGSPLAAYGTPRAVFNPRQLQFALRFSF